MRQLCLRFCPLTDVSLNHLYFKRSIHLHFVPLPGTSMDDEELLELISERKTISKTVEDYEGRKSTSLTTAVRFVLFCFVLFVCSLLCLAI